MMGDVGATVHASPSRATKPARTSSAAHPDSTGSLGIAISEAVEAAGGSADTRYALGSVLNHVLMHQTVIGEEALKQFAAAGESAPDLIVGCTGGGSELRRSFLPVPAGEAGRPVQPGDPRGRAGRLPVVHPRPVRLRLRRHGRVHPAAEDAHPRPRLHPGPGARGRAALSRHVPAALAHVRARPVRAESRQQRECFAAAITFARAEGIIPPRSRRMRSPPWSRRPNAAPSPARRR